MDNLYNERTNLLNSSDITEAWDSLKTRISGKNKNKKVHCKANVSELFSLEFTNTHMKITHMLIIHLKEEDMIKLMNYDIQLLEAMKTDVDDLGNTCAHIALMYDKQNILSELLSIMPEFTEVENNNGFSVSEYSDWLERTPKLDIRSRKIMTNNSPISCASQNTHFSQE